MLTTVVCGSALAIAPSAGSNQYENGWMSPLRTLSDFEVGCHEIAAFAEAITSDPAVSGEALTKQKWIELCTQQVRTARTGYTTTLAALGNQLGVATDAPSTGPVTKPSDRERYAFLYSTPFAAIIWLPSVELNLGSTEFAPQLGIGLYNINFVENGTRYNAWRGALMLDLTFTKERGRNQRIARDRINHASKAADVSDQVEGPIEEKPYQIKEWGISVFGSPGTFTAALDSPRPRDMFTRLLNLALDKGDTKSDIVTRNFGENGAIFELPDLLRILPSFLDTTWSVIRPTYFGLRKEAEGTMPIISNRRTFVGSVNLNAVGIAGLPANIANKVFSWIADRDLLSENLRANTVVRVNFEVNRGAMASVKNSYESRTLLELLNTDDLGTIWRYRHLFSAE